MTCAVLTDNTLQMVLRPGEGFFLPSFRISENKGIGLSLEGYGSEEEGV